MVNEIIKISFLWLDFHMALQLYQNYLNVYLWLFYFSIIAETLHVVKQMDW